jgi:hypothetical protein
LSLAARQLSEYGICIIIDASDNATRLESERAYHYEMEPISDELISTFPELRDLFEFLKKSNLYDEVLATCGGVVYLIQKLNTLCYLKGYEKRKDIVEHFVIKQINNAIYSRIECISRYPEMENVLNKFKTIQTAGLDANLISKHANDSQLDFKNVLRFEKRTYTYKPASRAMSIVLRSGIEKVKSFAEVRGLISSMKNKAIL